jgi:hypothetical protein
MSINICPVFADEDPVVNVLVITLYKLEKSGLIGDTNVYDKYKYCFNKCMQSYLKHNPELFHEIIVLENYENAHNNMTMEYQTTKKIKDIWFTKKCNLLYIEIDTLCFGKLDEIFKLDKFSMFAGGSAPTTELNSGILYFPRNMNVDIWNIFDELHNNFNFEKYAYFQEIFDKMFRCQFNNEKEAFKYIENIGFGKYNWFNGLINPYGSIIPENKAIIKHYFSSRGIDNLVNIFKNCEDLTIDFKYTSM